MTPVANIDPCCSPSAVLDWILKASPSLGIAVRLVTKPQQSLSIVYHLLMKEMFAFSLRVSGSEQVGGGCMHVSQCQPKTVGLVDKI